MSPEMEWWIEQNSTVNKFGSKTYSPFVCHIANLFDERTHGGRCECRWHSPYGFVVEAGCAEHDR
jgi:hypothetical protein